jgi:uncharacterized protein (DUF1330 family)
LFHAIIIRHKSNMSVIMTTLATLNPNGASALEKYAEIVVPLIRAAGGEVLSRSIFREGLVGEEFPQFVASIRFPDADRARGMIQSPEYRQAVPHRNDAFREVRTFIGDAV